MHSISILSLVLSFFMNIFMCMSFLTSSAVNKGGKQARTRKKFLSILTSLFCILGCWLLFSFMYHHHYACLVILYMYIYIYIYICVNVRAESKTQYKRVIVVVAVGWSRRVIERRWNIEINCMRHRSRL